MTIWYDKASANKSSWEANTALALAMGVEITI